MKIVINSKRQLYNTSLGQPSFPGMVWPIGKTPFHLSLEKIALRSSHEVLIEVDGNFVLIVGNLRGILGW